MLNIGMIVFPKGLIGPQLYRVADVQGRHADLRPMTLGGVPMQSPASDLRRYRIRTTDEVSWNEELVEIVRVLNPLSEDDFEYEVIMEGQVYQVAEQELTVMEGSLAPDPAAMLAQSDIAPWNLVNSRTRLLESFFAATARSMGIVGYNGARMLPIPHQINAARYAIQFGRIRFLLADEVGLGKTVEAGLIVSTLRKYFSDWQTAIFVPESLTAQWAFEMYGKFGKSVFALSEDDFDDDEAGIILPHESAVDFADRYQPEMLIVDEAHRILHDPQMVKALTKLSRKAHTVLLLTATPVSHDMRNLLHLLQVLDPDKFSSMKDVEELRALQAKEGKIEAVLQAIRTPNPDPAKILKAWKATEITDKEIAAHIGAAHGDNIGRHDLHRMAAAITDRYYPGARILRYRRKFLSQDNALPFRIVDSLPYTPTAEEQAVLAASREWLDLLRDADLADNADAQQAAAALVQAAHSSPLAVADWLAMRRGETEDPEGVTADPILLARRAMEALEELDGEDEVLEKMEAANTRWQRATRAVDATGRQLAQSPRYQTFLKFLKETFEEEPDGHLLVFTAFEANVHPLYLLLRKALTDIAEVYEMSGRMSRVEREKNAFEFQEFPSGSVLISDELGGEGRNFQFASHVVHFDLPPAPWTVEQRIGRTDRVGREEEMDVDSQVIVAKGQLDEALYDFLAEGVGVFNESIAPVEGELDRVVRKMMVNLINDGAQGVLEEIEDVAEMLEEARERENAELLVRGAVGVEEARRIATELNDEKELAELQKQTINYARIFESMVDEQANHRLAITVGEFHTLHAVPGVAGEMIGYFNRKLAVRHERLNFFSPGHPFVRTLALTAMVESPDRAAIVRRKGIEEAALLCSFRIAIPPEFFQFVRELEVDLRPPLLSKSAALFGTKMLRIAVALDGTIVPATPENAKYYADYQESDQSLDEWDDLEGIVPENWDELCIALSGIAMENAEEIADMTYAERSPELEDLACEVLMRVKPDLADSEDEVARILSEFGRLNVDLDSIVLFVK